MSAGLCPLSTNAHWEQGSGNQVAIAMKQCKQHKKSPFLLCSQHLYYFVKIAVFGLSPVEYPLHEGRYSLGWCCSLTLFSWSVVGVKEYTWKKESHSRAVRNACSSQSRPCLSVGNWSSIIDHPGPLKLWFPVPAELLLGSSQREDERGLGVGSRRRGTLLLFLSDSVTSTHAWPATVTLTGFLVAAGASLWRLSTPSDIQHVPSEAPALVDEGCLNGGWPHGRVSKKERHQPILCTIQYAWIVVIVAKVDLMNRDQI